MLLIAGAHASLAGVNVWTTYGPDGAIVEARVIDPHAPSTLYAGTAGGGEFDIERALAGPCVGDCNQTGSVTVSNIITLVNMALDNAQPSACPHGIPNGAEVDIAMIVQAVHNALNGCQGASPSPTPTPTRTPRSPTPTPTMGLTLTTDQGCQETAGDNPTYAIGDSLTMWFEVQSATLAQVQATILDQHGGQSSVILQQPVATNQWISLSGPVGGPAGVVTLQLSVGAVATQCSFLVVEAGGACAGQPDGTTCDAGMDSPHTSICTGGTCGPCTANASASPRFVDNGDGTITDRRTCLVWEKKDNAGGLHDLTHTYPWSASGTAADGGAFTLFLAGLNNAAFAGHRDWRLPTSAGSLGSPTGQAAELESIVDTRVAGCEIVALCVDPPFNTNCGVNSSGNPGCTVDGAGGTHECSCTQADGVYWSATTSAGNAFVAWVVLFGNGDVTEGTKTFGNSVRAVRGGSSGQPLPTATVSPTTYNLNVDGTGSGSGTITGSGINCGTTCSVNLASAIQLTLFAIPNSGSTFASWSGCDSTNGNMCTVTMNQNRTVTATFAAAAPQSSYTLAVTMNGWAPGLYYFTEVDWPSLGKPIYCYPGGLTAPTEWAQNSPCTYSFPPGTHVTLQIFSDSGPECPLWSGCDSVSTADGTCALTINHDSAVTATWTGQNQPKQCLPTTTCIHLPSQAVTLEPNWQCHVWTQYRDQVVLLYYGDECAPWTGQYSQHDEPHLNYCGPTAGMNLLQWYGTPSTYARLASQMETNSWASGIDWFSDCACNVCSVTSPLCFVCPPCFDPVCTTACLALTSNSLVDVGTLPEHMVSALMADAPPNYILTGQFTPGSTQTPATVTEFYDILSKGAPIAVLITLPKSSSPVGFTLHWALVTGIGPGEFMPRVQSPGGPWYTPNCSFTDMCVLFANNDPMTWDNFVNHAWALRDANSVELDILQAFQIYPYTYLYYQKE